MTNVRIKRICIHLLSLIIIIFNGSPIFASVSVSGIISENTTWYAANSPYIVTNNILVNEGVILTIEPGVIIQFDSDKTLQINGTLSARGTENAKIIFTSNLSAPRAGDWGYILFSDSSVDAMYDADGKWIGGSILEYCLIEYANGVSENSIVGAIGGNNAHPFISKCIIKNNNSYGVYGWNLTSNFKIHDCQINNNHGGIYLSGGIISIRNNTIIDNAASYGGGVVVMSGNETIDRNLIKNNSANDYAAGGGIYIGSGAICNITNNEILNNSSGNHGGGIYAHPASTVSIIGNTLRQNSSEGWGGGIYAAGNFKISKNIIYLNHSRYGGGIEAKDSVSSTEIRNNIFLSNSASFGGAIHVDTGTVNIYENIIIKNISSYGSAIYYYPGIYVSEGDIKNNLITSNIMNGMTGCSVEMRNNYSLTYNNIFNNISGFEFCNNNPTGTPKINAKYNWWNSNEEINIQSKIYDWFDDGAKGIVEYLPFLASPDINAPISPPTGLNLTYSGENTLLTWGANPESDVAGYKIYWGSSSGFPYENVLDVGNVTNYSLSELTHGTYISITAYDSNYGSIEDDPSTITNEKQTSGHESWFSVETIIDKLGPSGTIAINSNATHTKSTSVILNLQCQDASGCAEMKLSADYTTWLAPESYTSGKSWELSAGDGTKTVYVKFKDGAGNWSSVYSDTIILDTVLPVTTPSIPGGTYVGSQTIALSTSKGATIYYTLDGSTPTISSFIYSKPINMTTSMTLKYFARDRAGNESTVQMADFIITNILSGDCLIPDTGQTKCYDNTVVDIPCRAPGEAFYGQDGNYGINPPSYTKLDASGNVLPNSATSWAMVRDNVTGLIWENKTSDGSLHDGGKKFTWCDRNLETNGGDQGKCGTGTDDAAIDTEAFIKALNDTKFGSFSDWRLPTAKELATIVDWGRYSPTVNTDWYPNTVSSHYWSSTTHAYYNFYAWYVNFSDSFASVINKTNANAVRAVRGGELRNRYLDNGDKTVTDTRTGLMWQQETQIDKSWQAALEYAENLTLAGFDDWRLPNIAELQSLVDYHRITPSIDVATFPGTVSSGTMSTCYWSSTTNANFSGDARCVDFGNGYPEKNNKTNFYAVRTVRGGQSRSLGNFVISAPTQASRLAIGELQTIAWDTAGIIGNVKITLSREGGKAGTFAEVIAESVPNNGYYTWTVTGPESFNCALRIEPLSDAAKGTTQSLFTIVTMQNTWLTALKQRDPAHFKVTLNGRFSDGDFPLAATLAVSDPAVATLDNSGNLTALKNGYVEISTTYNGKTYKKGLFVYTTMEWGETESNNDKATADSLMVSGKSFYQGTLPAGDIDWFTFTLANPSFVNVGYLSKSATADVKIELFSSAEVLMASAVSTNGESAILPVGLPAGNYYLKLSSAGDIDQMNNYIVTYKVMDTLPADTTIPINLSETKAETITTLADQADFTFTLPSEQAVKLVFTPTSGIAKYRLILLNNNQTVVDQLDCLDQRPVSFDAIYAAGSYTLRVMPAGTTVSGVWTPAGPVDAMNPFSISLEANLGQLEKEPNDTAAQATPFDIGKPLIGRLSSAMDTDFYAFILDRPRFLELNFASPYSTGDFNLTLYKESDQNEIDGIDILAGKTTSLHMGLGIGRYLLCVKGKGTNIDAIHNYTLTVTDSSQTDLEIESNNTIKFANAIGKDQPKRGRIYSATDKDYFGFNLTEVGILSLNFTPTSTTGSYKVSIVNENDAVLGSSYTSSGGSALNIADIFFDMPGNYYLLVESNGTIDQYKPYSLGLTSTAAITGIKQLVNIAVMGTKTTMTVGDTQMVNASAGYSDATATPISTPIWASLDSGIATVNAAGLVTAVAQGTTSIVATYGGITGKFDLTVGAPVNVVKQHYGNLILVAGGGIADTNTLKESTQYLSDLVYRRFKARLFGDEDIYYFNPMPFHDINGDGYGENIVDETVPTIAKFGNAITQWATSQSTDGPLYVYLIDHGGIDNFMIYPGEIVTADQLKTYLDTFQTATGRKVVVMIEACKSGSFTDNLAVQGQNRVVVTSTDNQDAYIQLGGRISFSQFFVDRLLTGDSIYQSYLKAKNQMGNMGIPYSSMRPQLVEGVSNTAAQTMIGGDFAIASLFPEITETSAGRFIQANTNQNFYAKLSSLEGIESVWAVVIPPDYVAPATSGDLTAPQVSLPTIELADPDKDRTYDGSYNAFTKNGDYRITFYARNENGNVTVYSPQTVVTVSGGIETGKTLSVTKSGTGAGTVTSQPVGIDCGSDCSESYSTPVSVTLTAAAAQGSTFAGWAGGGCSGTSSCTVTMDATRTIDAGFALNSGAITGRVSANVLGYTDLGVRNATVTLEGTSYSVSPDANGNFSLQNIPYGNYTLVISAPNMETITRAVSVTGVSQQVTLPAMNPAPAASGLKGDANEDGQLGLADIIYILQVLGNIRQP